MQARSCHGGYLNVQGSKFRPTPPALTKVPEIVSGSGRDVVGIMSGIISDKLIIAY
jgi:hypothetical protein